VDADALVAGGVAAGAGVLDALRRRQAEAGGDDILAALLPRDLAADIEVSQARRLFPLALRGGRG